MCTCCPYPPPPVGYHQSQVPLLLLVVSPSAPPDLLVDVPHCSSVEYHHRQAAESSAPCIAIDWASPRAKPATAENHPEPPGAVCILDREDLTMGYRLRSRSEAISSSPTSMASPSTSPTHLMASLTTISNRPPSSSSAMSASRCCTTPAILRLHLIHLEHQGIPWGLSNQTNELLDLLSGLTPMTPHRLTVVAVVKLPW
jgi:hypothetical protein